MLINIHETASRKLKVHVYSWITTMHTCERSKAIGHVIVIIVIVDTKIIKSRDLGALVSVCVETSATAYKHHK